MPGKHALAAWLTALSLLGAVPVARRASAQSTGPIVDPTTTSTSTTSTSTTTPDAAATTTTTPGGPGAAGPTTSTTVPVPESDAPTEAPPTGITVPPPATPTTTVPTAAPVNQALVAAMAKAKKVTSKADVALAAAAEAEQSAQLAFDDARKQFDALSQHRKELSERLLTTRRRVADEAVGAYTGDSLGRVNFLLQSGDINAYARRSGFIAGLMNEGRHAIREYEKARKEAGSRLAALVDRMSAQESELILATAKTDTVAKDAADAHITLDALKAGSQIVVSGFVFPVQGTHTFSNDFGNPRNVGTPFEHTHQGNDIFAAKGTPLVACERGVVTRVGQDILGGTKLWIVGQSGTRYYYAHLSAYAPGVSDGTVVDAGTVVAFVGNTGDAAGGPPHLHFEIHPGGGPAVNPYFLLKAVDDADKARAATTTTTTTSPAAVPATSGGR